MKKKLSLIIILLVLCLAFWCWHQIQQFARRPLDITQEVLFTLAAGTSRVALETLLVENKLITDVRWFPWLLHMEPQRAKFKAGTYRLVPGMKVRELLDLLASGKEAQFSIRFVEGTSLRIWLQVLHHAEYVRHQLADKSDQEIAGLFCMKTGIHPEGWFYPDTYYYTAGTSDVSLLKRAHERMKNVINQLWQSRDKTLPYKTPDELLIMASIIEKETALDDERAKIASVFVNRLRRGMRLQTDPTVIYGMGDRYTGIITRKDLATATPYNTYLIAGLPPTPISMPGLASLTAAAHPATTPWFYFVTDGKGGHTFSTDLASHNKAVKHYRQTLKASNER